MWGNVHLCLHKQEWKRMEDANCQSACCISFCLGHHSIDELTHPLRDRVEGSATSSFVER